MARRAPRARSMAYEFGKPFALYRSDARGCRGAPWGSAKQHSVASLADPPRQAEPSYRRPAPFVVTWRDDARRGLHLSHLLPRIARYQRAGAFHNASSANATRASAGPPTYYIEDPSPTFTKEDLKCLPVRTLHGERCRRRHRVLHVPPGFHPAGRRSSSTIVRATRSSCSTLGGGDHDAYRRRAGTAIVR